MELDRWVDGVGPVGAGFGKNLKDLLLDDRTQAILLGVTVRQRIGHTLLHSGGVPV